MKILLVVSVSDYLRHLIIYLYASGYCTVHCCLGYSTTIPFILKAEKCAWKHVVGNNQRNQEREIM